MSHRQGEIWWARAADKRRPVLIVSRSEASAALNRLVCAPITTTVRGIPTEVPLGKRQGLPRKCAASFDNLQLIARGTLTEKVGALDDARRKICGALSALADC